MSPSIRIAACLAFLAFAALSLVQAPSAEAQKKILNIAAKEPDTLDPHSSTLGQSQAISRFMFRGLTRFAIKDGKVTTAEVEPDLAESWTISPEGTIWTLKLRKGVQFHKGYGEMTAEDVKFSFERQISKAPGTRYGVNLDVIKSIEVVEPAHRPDRPQGLRSHLPAADGRLSAGLHHLEEGRREARRRGSSGIRSAPARSTSSGTRRARRSS